MRCMRLRVGALRSTSSLLAGSCPTRCCRVRSRATPDSEMSSQAWPSGRPQVVVITGPTAVGKTDASLALALRLGGEIISADSVQVYRGLDIGSDKARAAHRSRRPGRRGGAPRPTGHGSSSRQALWDGSTHCRPQQTLSLPPTPASTLTLPPASLRPGAVARAPWSATPPDRRAGPGAGVLGRTLLRGSAIQGRRDPEGKCIDAAQCRAAQPAALRCPAAARWQPSSAPTNCSRAEPLPSDGSALLLPRPAAAQLRQATTQPLPPVHCRP